MSYQHQMQLGLDVVWSEEAELRARKEAGDIIHGDDPRRAPLIPGGGGRFAQEFRGIFDPREYSQSGLGKAQLIASTYLTGKQAERMYNAASFCIGGYGKTFDAHIVFSWKYVDLSDHEAASERFIEVKDRIRKRLTRKHRMKAHFVYVHENSRNHGFHTHMLLHAGSAWPDLEAWLPGDVAAVCDMVLPGNMLHMRHRRQRQRFHRTALHWIWTRYLLKGVDPEVKVRDLADKRRLIPLWEDLRLRPRSTGLVQCRKRVGVSDTLNEMAQTEAGFHSPFALGMNSWMFSDAEFEAYRDTLARKEANKRAIDSLSFLLDG